MEKFADTFRVRISDANSRGYLKLASLLGMFQEVASDHAETLNIGSTALNPQGLGWALSKIFINFSDFPKCGERLKILTWPSTRTKIFSEREFVVIGANGKIFATARSLWVLFDLEKRRLERLDRLPVWQCIEEFANEESFGDIPSFPENDEDFISSFGVRKDDLDLNGHVNNVVYFTWALEPLPDEFYNSHLIKRAQMCFLSEVFRTDRPKSVCRINGQTSLHKICAEGKERMRAAIDWIHA